MVVQRTRELAQDLLHARGLIHTCSSGGHKAEHGPSACAERLLCAAELRGGSVGREELGFTEVPQLREGLWRDRNHGGTGEGWKSERLISGASMIAQPLVVTPNSERVD